MKKALITGITGQVGSYLAELLLDKNYEVHGIVRRSSAFNTHRINHIFNRINLHYGDLADSASLRSVVEKAEPDEVYNLAAQSHVRVSFDVPEYTSDVTALGVLRLLDAIPKTTRFYQASSSEIFGNSPAPQNELTPIHPRSPYACAKAYGYFITQNHRERGWFACNGILFNTESPRRGETFVTRKITRAIARIRRGQQETLELGNLDSKRDWGHAKEYAEAIWRIVQHHEPDDFVIGTGESHTVREFLHLAFEIAGIEDRDRRVVINPKYFRETEVPHLLADASKAKRLLDWEPKIRFEAIVSDMVMSDLIKADL